MIGDQGENLDGPGWLAATCQKHRRAEEHRKKKNDQLVEAGAFLLDVRKPTEGDDFHAPQATLIVLDELASRVDDIPKDQYIMAICRSGNRSQIGRDTLLADGYSNIPASIVV